MPLHPALEPGRVAVVTGAASGIGLAAAEKFASLGMKVVMSDVNGGALEAAEAGVTARTARKNYLRICIADVSAEDEVARLKDFAFEEFGEVAVLMNNAGIGGGGGASAISTSGAASSRSIFGASSTACRPFAPAMITQGAPAAIVNTGSKQGITCPPGDTAYNVSKAGVKVLTEALAHELRNTEGCQVSAHLLIPGFTFTGHHGAGARSRRAPGRPSRSSTSCSTRLAAGDFYILCPDNEVSRAHGREAHPVGGGRHHREPPGAVALASRLQGRFRRVRRRRGALIALRLSSGTTASRRTRGQLRAPIMNGVCQASTRSRRSRRKSSSAASLPRRARDVCGQASVSPAS